MHLLRRHTHANMQANSKGLNTYTHSFRIPGNQYSETRPIPEADGRKGEVHFSLCSTMCCLLLADPFDCVRAESEINFLTHKIKARLD